MRIYRDGLAEVHEGDIVRYVRWNWSARRTDNRLYKKTGTVVEILPQRPGAVGVHFPHHARGVNVLATADDLRLVSCPHEPVPGTVRAFRHEEDSDNRYPGQPALPGTTGISRHELREGWR